MIDPNVFASKVDEVERLSKEVYLLRQAIDKSNADLADAVEMIEQRHRYKEALMKIAYKREDLAGDYQRWAKEGLRAS